MNNSLNPIQHPLADNTLVVAQVNTCSCSGNKYTAITGVITRVNRRDNTSFLWTYEIKTLDFKQTHVVPATQITRLVQPGELLFT